MRKTLQELMASLGCEKWPARWETFYNTVMDDVEQNGCVYATPAYYDYIGDTYHILFRYRDVYKTAAKEVGENPDLTAFLALLCYTLADRENYKDDLKELSFPKAPEGVSPLAYDMLTGLAICSQVEYSDKKLRGMGLDQEMITKTLSLPELGIWEYEKRHHGKFGYHLLSWFQLAIEGQLFRIDRLEMEFFSKFHAKAKVFCNQGGDCIAMAHELMVHKSGIALGSKHFEDEEGSWEALVEETEDAWVGYPIDERSGIVSNTTVTLSKQEWTLALSRGDVVIGVHIPPDGSLKDEDVERTIAHTREFAKTYFPHVEYKAFTCHSWLMDPQLCDMLGEESNIAKFCRRFKKTAYKSDGNAVFGFVYLIPDKDVSIPDLPENTRLERALKNHYLNGKAIYELCGYFF